MQREHSRSDSKGERLQWELISENGINEPPRKRKKLNSDDEAQQEIVNLNRSQISTPSKVVEEARPQDGSSLDEEDF